MKRRIVIFAFAFIALLDAGDVFAQMVEILPESSYYYGHTHYDEQTEDDGYLRGRIDFAVYDTESETYVNEFTGEPDGFVNPGTGRYIYAYQIFNDSDLSDEAVAYFAILGIDDDMVNGTSWQDDQAGGIPPTDPTPPPEGVWIWEFEGGFVYASEHSTFLVFSSDLGWGPGSYEIRAPQEDDFPIPVPGPATIALLGLGGAAAFFHFQQKKTRTQLK